MINRRAKGNVAELRARKYLERMGYLVHRAQQSGFKAAGGKWLARTNDVWNVFDLLAMAQGHKVLGVQVTASPSAAAQKRRDLLELATHYPLEHMDVELWVWYGGKKTKRSDLHQVWKAERLVRRIAWAPGEPLTTTFVWESLGFIDMDDKEERDGQEPEVHQDAEGEDHGQPEREHWYERAR